MRARPRRRRGKGDASHHRATMSPATLGMSWRFLIVNALLLALSLTLFIFIVREMTPPRESVELARTAPAPGTVATPDNAPAPTGPAVYSVIGTRNLFSPTRTEPTKAEAVTGAATLRPNLLGVVLDGEQSIAYLEDPVTKRVFGYRLGDALAGGVVRAIESDRIVLERETQRLDIELHDPSRSRQSLSTA